MTKWIFRAIPSTRSMKIAEKLEQQTSNKNDLNNARIAEQAWALFK